MFFYLIKGGPVLIVIGLCSIAAGAFSVIQWLRLRKTAQDHSQSLGRIVREVEKRDWASALRTCEHNDHPFFIPWRACFALLIEGKSDLRDIEETVHIEGSKMTAELESPLKPLAALTTALPMLGFLGTILGLIVSFQNWEQMGAQVSISRLASGIYQAMITTAGGLITAIPYHLLYHYFTARAEGAALEFSKETTDLFRWIKDALLRDIALDSESHLTPPADIRQR